MKQKLEKVCKGLSKEQWEDITDGHGNYAVGFYVKRGFPEKFVAQCEETYKSDGTWKGSIWKDQNKALVVLAQLRELKKGDPIPDDLARKFDEVYVAETTSVYSLTFLRHLARTLEVEYAGSLGRGSEARHIVKAIQSYLHLECTTF